MLGVVDLPTYLVGLTLIILLPGPNSIYVLSVAARRGVRSGYTAAVGVFTGDAVLMALSAAGVASLLRASEGLFSIVKWSGALYLAYLALGMLRAGWVVWRTRHDVSLADTMAAVTAESDAKERPYRRALVVSLLNPKAILFFVAFFVQFVDPLYPHAVVPFIVLGAFCQLFSAIYLSVLIFSGTRLAQVFRRRRALSAGASASVGALFLIFAARLSLA